MILYPAALLFAAWVLWRLFSSYRARAALSKVPGPPASSFLTGDLPQLFDRIHGWDFLTEIADKYGPVVKLNMPLGAPMLHISDTAALREVVKNPETFDEPAWWIRTIRLLLGEGVISVEGEPHRKQRRMLAPLFSPKHLRSLVPTLYEVTDKVVGAINAHIPGQSASIDMAGWIGRTTLEISGQTIIGYSFDPLTEDVPDDFADALKSFFPTMITPQMMALFQFIPYVVDLGPAWLRRWFVDRIPIKSVRKMQRISDTIHARSVQIFTEKKAALLAGEKTEHRDLMSILLKSNMAASERDALKDHQVLAQICGLTLAAMDSTANMLARTLHALAQHQDVQEKLRSELREVRASGPVDYDDLLALPYLDAVCKESLRLLSPAPQTFRRAARDAVLPLEAPIRGTDGSLIKELVVPAGTPIFVGMRSCDRRKDHWGSDAYEWKPERWLKPVPEALEKAAVPGVCANLMAFLGGPRSCLGFAYGQLEMKVVLCELLVNFQFELSDKDVIWNLSHVSYPSTSVESTKPEMWLKVTKLEAEP
ncbi:cytochrome P450 [Trametes elegans]|nr:cytochrome P450 [Trametes elegans]